jgi:hypothetical protein
MFVVDPAVNTTVGALVANVVIPAVSTGVAIAWGKIKGFSAGLKGYAQVAVGIAMTGLAAFVSQHFGWDTSTPVALGTSFVIWFAAKAKLPVAAK